MYNSLLHKVLLVKPRKYDSWTASCFGENFIRIFLRYIVTQYVQLRDLFLSVTSSVGCHYRFEFGMTSCNHARQIELDTE